MGFFGSLGKGLGAVGKGLLSVVKTGVNVAGSVAGIGAIFPPSNGGTVQAQAASLPSPQTAPVVGNVPVAASPSLMDTLKYTFGSIGDWFSGKTHAQIDANVGAGGRVTDLPGTGSPFPSWLIPVGLGGAALLLLSGRSRRR